MQLLAIVYAVASVVIGVSASPIRQNQYSAAKHPPQILEDSGTASNAPHGEFLSISSPPKVVSTRSDGDEKSDNLGRGFDTISPAPKVLPPRSDNGEFLMTGVMSPDKAALLSGGKLPTVHARKDGFITITPPSKTAAGDAAIRARDMTVYHLDTISPPPKTRPSDTKLDRRDDIWSSSSVSKVVNKWSGKRQDTPASTKSASNSSDLTSYEQNGPSTYGTADMETLPKYYGGGSQTPWGGITTTNANPYKSCPLTGETRSYDFTIAECNIRPDGVETKKAVCVNGQFPGPLIEANYGDMIQVKVTNKLQDEGTSMHWHGFLQTGANNMDGVPGVTQCPIAPNDTMTYEFRAELYGSTWYHTHYSAQYSGGAVGPIVIYGPTNKNADIDVGPVMLSDWYRNDYMTNIRGLLRPVAEGGPINPLTNSNLINGKMRFPCEKTNLSCSTADYSVFKFTSGKNHLLRLMNLGSNAVQKFAIDGHTMQVIANDFMPVVPYNTSMIALGVGQRADVIVYGSGNSGDKFWLRSNIIACSVNDGLLTEALGAIYYEDADMTTLPTAAPNQGPAADPSPRSCGNDPLTQTVPAFPLKASTPGITRNLDIRMKNNGTHLLLNFGDNSFRANFNDPLLSRALVGMNGAYATARNVWNVGSAKTMRAVISNYDNTPHPIHLHGHNMQILTSGFGPANLSNIGGPENPQRRDVMVMPPGSETTPSYLVIQWDADNPGVWPLHCHFSWHSSLGLAMNVLETPSVINRILGLAASAPIAQTCRKWNAFTKAQKELVTGIDSGM